MDISQQGNAYGRYKFSVAKQLADGSVDESSRRDLTDWVDNLVLNAGIARMGGFADWLVWCQVGAGTATPSPADTGLQSRIGATNNRVTTSTGVLSSAPYYVWRRNTYRFTAGQAAGNLAEVGVGWSSDGSLFSRARIVDSGGLPTTIQILSDEVLDVIYEFRFQPSSQVFEGSIQFTGNIGGTYAYRMSAARAGLAGDTGWSIGANGSDMTLSPSFPDSRRVYNGPIGPITGEPSGPGPDVPVTPFGYDPATGAQYGVFLGVSDGNVAGGIRSIILTMGIGTYQFEFTPAIPKTTANALTLFLYHNWGRL